MKVPNPKKRKSQEKRLGLGILGLLFLAAFLFACSSVNKTDEEKERTLILKNKIKSVTEYITMLHGGIEEKEQVRCVKLFNAKGFIVKKTAFITEDSIESIVIYEYDKNDNLILTNGLNHDSSLVFKETRNYDGKNRKDLYSYLPDGTYKYRNSATWDNKGRMIEIHWYGDEGLRARNVFAYDGAKKIEDIEYDPNGKLKYKWRYKYDAKKNLMEAIQYYPGNIINGKTSYEYNKYNQMIKQTNYTGESIQKMITYEYNKKYLLSAKTEYSPSGRISAKYRYHYEFL